MGEYLVVDKLYGFSIEPNDILRAADGNEIVVSFVDSVEGGYDIHYKDLDGEEDIYHLPEDDMIDLLILE